MFAGLFTAIINAVLGLFGLRRAAPKIEDIAASNATAQAELTQETARVEIAHTAVAAASAADARSLREQPGASADTVVTGPGAAPINDPDLPYRD